MPPSITRFNLTQSRCSTSNLHISFTTSRWRVAVKPVSCLLFWLLSPLSPLRLSPVIIKFTFLVFFQDSREAVIWLAVHHKQKKALELFSREVAPAGTGMGTTNPVISSLNSLNLFIVRKDLYDEIWGHLDVVAAAYISVFSWLLEGEQSCLYSSE